ncbi:alpha/beta fold hydrolase [Allofranklinella schreckenbergeri]|uniref:Alpha/beta fold hydrolase n=1 Tax=Allofranklinella schreckenbergeri TaxID=1076744 RepID=A0A3M6QW63_9BURK|nr:alpha/beta fold hydrolase [Allofranklinella schreckenbergeri]RMX07121.1 alpha/beta fold hydrolase [Allofranklinella schreckenbergeri]
MQLTLTPMDARAPSAPGDAALAPAPLHDAASQAATGAPAPLVLLHGWGLDRRVWLPLLPHLRDAAPHLPVYLADLPGYHGSAYAGEDAQAVAHALATQLPPGCTLVGWSLGGMLAQLAASSEAGSTATQPGSRIARLALIGSTPSFVRREGFACAQQPVLLSAFAQAVRALPASVLPRFATLSNQGDSRAKAINRQLLALTQPPLPDQAALLAGLDWLQTLDLRAQAAHITQPALIIHGGQDGLMPLAAAQWLADHLPQAERLTLPDAAHAPFLHDPAQCAAALARWAGAMDAQA